MEGLKPCVRSTFESDIYMSTVKSDLHITMTNILKSHGRFIVVSFTFSYSSLQWGDHFAIPIKKKKSFWIRGILIFFTGFVGYY